MMPQPAIGSAQWWVLRPAWLAPLTVVLVPMIMAIMRAERPMGRLPAGVGLPGPWSPALLLADLAASQAGLSQLTAAGFAPGTRPTIVRPRLTRRPCSASIAHNRTGPQEASGRRLAGQ